MILHAECKLWEAATTFFDPITIDRGSVRFVDDAMRYNNPVGLVSNEATDL